MHQSLERFDIHINAIDDAIKTLNKSQKIFDGKVIYELRTALFMIQGLSRLYAQMYKNPRLFNKIKEQSKTLEDAIGAIDHYHNLTEELSLNNYPPKIITHFQKKLKSSEKDLEKIFNKNKWSSLRRTKKWRKKLQKFKWHEDEEDTIILGDVYRDELTEVIDFIDALEYPLSEMEHEVHELRRKLRWLSIYVQCSNGLFITAKNVNRERELKLYHSPEIVHSPFTNLEKNDSIKKPIILSHPDFIALSWVIKQLGDIKDNGLIYYEVSHFLNNQNNNKGSLDNVMNAYILESYKGLEVGLYEAENVVAGLIKNKVLEHILF